MQATWLFDPDVGVYCVPTLNSQCRLDIFAASSTFARLSKAHREDDNPSVF